MLRRAAAALAVLLAVAAVVTTLLPLSHSNAWWVRMWEFPRQNIAIGAAVAFLLAWALPQGPRGATLLAMATVVGWQGWWIWPHAPWAEEEVAVVGGDGARIVSLNVLQGNRDHDRTLAYLRDRDPDVLLLMETDAIWADALAPVLDAYPYRVERIADDHYGMILVTRLPADRLELIDLSDDTTPAAVAELEWDGRTFSLAGLHPRPPVPATDTEERDEQIAKAATLARRDGVPSIAIGDFNDVSWSRASRRLRDIGGFKDPRYGRGILASFKADSWWLRAPIDHGLVTEGIVVHDFRLGPNVGSDHLPVELVVSVGEWGDGTSPAAVSASARGSDR